MSRLFLRCVGATLCLAAVPKLRHPLSFYAALKGYQLFHEASLQTLTFLVPALEVLVGLTLLLWVSRGALVWAAFLFTGFSAALIWARFHHLSLTCGCFGRLDSTLHRLPHGLALHILLTATVSGSLIYLLWRGETVAED